MADTVHRIYPRIQPGDRLWVRETFQPLFADGFEHGDERIDWGTGAGYAVRYMATDSRVEWVDGDDAVTDRCKPSIHMPRWASRILLEVTEVRVERLQDISEVDAFAEGAECIEVGGEPGVALSEWSHREGFIELWQSINGPDSWALNPWVWVVSFRRIES
jgi:hypothetical protein